MRNQNIDQCWQFQHGLYDEFPDAEKAKSIREVNLPHDYMIESNVSESAASGPASGYYTQGVAYYTKLIDIPQEWEQEAVYLHFDGIMMNATVDINGCKAILQHNGYIPFSVNITPYLYFGKKNRVTITVAPSMQPNSRWYSGAGIFRSIELLHMPKLHIASDGIFGYTKSIEYDTLGNPVCAYLHTEVELQNETLENKMALVEVFLTKDGSDEVLLSRKQKMQINPNTTDTAYLNLTLENPELWDVENPNLYKLHARVTDLGVFKTHFVPSEKNTTDETSVLFGVKTITADVKHGLRINGKTVKLKGGCIHHDSGLLGACAYEFAERRKIRILLDAGYNAIRSAHNPCSKALLRACDEMGMLVMDEYIDGWYIHKTKYDYADEILENYRKDLKDMVDKDYNHPSVIMYSTGNEVSETAQKKGISLTKSLTDRLHELDSTRPVSCGINIFFNFLSSMGFGVYSDKKADEAAENAKKKKAVGSEFYNTVAGIFGAGFMKTGATLYPCDVKTRDAYANMDVAGYNYGIKRYHHDLKKYPKRIILGSETFCADAYRFMQEAKRDKRIIGDFVWAAQDYLGEVGIGAWEYKDYAPRFDGGCGWVSAGSGRIDLTGKPLGEMAYTRVAFELEDLAIAVMPVDHTKDAHSPSAWKMTNAMESWSWEGCDGNAAKVEVYTRADHVKLYINGKCVGTKKPKNDCKVFFDTTYQNGEIKAVAYDANDNIIAERTLTTAGKETILVAEPELTRVNADTDLCYVRMRYTDENGQTKPLVRGRIQLTVEGGELLAFGSACPYYPESYQSNETDTYYGEALAIIRPQAGAGKVVVKAESELGNAEKEIEILD